MNRKLLTWAGLLVGLGLLLSSLYLYLFSSKIVFSSEDMAINAPETSVTKRIALKENDNPHKIFLNVDYEVTKEAKKDEHIVFSYAATLMNGKNEVVEHKSSSYNYYIQREKEKNQKLLGKKTDTVGLFTFKDLPTDTYTLTVAINPTADLDSPIVLDTFSYTIKKDVIEIPLILPIAGFVSTIISVVFMPRKKKHGEHLEKSKE